MKKNPHAVALGRSGGKARAKNLTPEERTAAARLAGLARQEKARQKKDQSNKSKYGNNSDTVRALPGSLVRSFTP
jgi:hypothetical protein